jgi:uncharacterized protein (DUF983 family)
MSPGRTIQTSEQLGVANSRLLLRGLLVRCPACGHRRTHRSFGSMRDRCLECSLRFERIEGHSMGYIGLNTIVTFALTFLVILIGAVATAPEVAVGPLAAAAMVTAGAVPVVFLRSAHTLWTAIDLVLRPLRPGEIDPRYVRVDPGIGPAPPR